jgi:hypothetical protein
VSYVLPDFRIKLRDCYDNDLMDSMVAAVECGFPQNPLNFLGQLLTGPPVPLDGPDEGIYCPRGGIIQAFIKGGASLPGPNGCPPIGGNLLSISLYGVKRYAECEQGFAGHFQSSQGAGKIVGYRPQFAYPTSRGCRDEDFVYYFDGSNVPLLANGLAAGVEIDYIPLPLDQDAPFYWRGWKVGLFITSRPVQ